MEEPPAVEEWRTTLTDYERRNLNNPVIVWRKWTAATRVKKPKARTAGFSASEMGRARHTVQEQDERIRELEEELAAAHERIQELEQELARAKRS
jgi:predicted RNase H-like nuclease (RuvC/YqgF family)